MKCVENLFDEQKMEVETDLVYRDTNSHPDPERIKKNDVLDNISKELVLTVENSYR